MLLRTFVRAFSSNQSLFKDVVLTNSKSKGKSSKEWLSRQLKDPYLEKAKIQNYRCRSAFKLLEINEKAKFITHGQTVVDLGAAPGSWTQVAVDASNAHNKYDGKSIGRVFSLDLLFIYPVEGATVISNMDFTTEEAQDKLTSLLSGKKADVVLSDMAPNATGVRSMDQDKIIALCYKALRFAAQISKKDASLLMKVWDGGEVPILVMDLERFYKHVKIIKPDASRSDSAEKFLLARGFKGIQTRESESKPSKKD